ncbi:MAG TPA: ferritin family protein [Terracidiphilus sp.]|jgi:rubrerythrin|nr:ferritin family protein [Terracidiphilus sp.]
MPAIASEHGLLVENLRSAFENECTARARYTAFADAADGERWHGIASLFRVAARAESVHAANHGRILHQLGGSTEFTPPPAEIGATIDNVRAALAGELFEVDTMYPAFLAHAREARDVAVVRAFTWALAAEKTHARLFNEAVALLELDLEDSWATMERDFFVCPVCGYTSENPYEAETCPACYCAWSRFEICH